MHCRWGCCGILCAIAAAPLCVEQPSLKLGWVHGQAKHAMEEAHCFSAMLVDANKRKVFPQALLGRHEEPLQPAKVHATRVVGSHACHAARHAGEVCKRLEAVRHSQQSLLCLCCHARNDPECGCVWECV